MNSLVVCVVLAFLLALAVVDVGRSVMQACVSVASALRSRYRNERTTP